MAIHEKEEHIPSAPTDASNFTLKKMENRWQ